VIVSIEQLTVVFRTGLARARFKALDGLNLEVREGDFFALLGPNGAGKSTTIYCMLGLLRPTAGSVRVFGQVLRPGCPAFAQVAFLPEEPHYHEYLTVEEAVSYYAGLYGSSPSSERVASTLEQLGLGSARAMRVSACSKGMKQKIGIAQCLLHQPRLIILDEPMRGLDPITVKEFRDALIDLHRKGVTIIMNSHLLSEVELTATRAAILNKGRLVAVDDIRALLHEQPDRYAVEVEGLHAPPEFLVVEGSSNGTLRGTIPVARLHDLIDLSRQAGALVRSCSLKRGTLEESFLHLVKADGAGRA
jgi:ABC-2 type transport system ATP-binding protein